MIKSVSTVSVYVVLALATARGFGDEGASFQVRTTVDLKNDRGQPLGTLWQASDSQGRPMAGAGFLNAYNTQDRSDRRMLHVYVRTTGETRFAPQRIARPTADAGTYLFGFDGKLFSKGRSTYMDDKLRVWNSTKGDWDVDTSTVPFSVHVAGKVFALTGGALLHGDQTVLKPAAGEGRLGEWYYAGGQLVVRRFDPQAEPPRNELLGFRWNPGDASLALDQGTSIPLSHPTEFIYAYGTLDGELLAASNRGGVHVLKNQKWKSVRTPDGKSFQVYSTLNTGDQLLLGQYPTGELFRYAQGKLQLLKGSPPVMQGVSPNARELQTLAIYGGDVYAGVWPWGEIWRRNLSTDQWQFLGRMFTHPEPTDLTTHPYENETKALDPVLNRWGQRVTSMVPLGDSLYISTSAKSHAPFEPKFKFLAGEKHREYGNIYRYRLPGCLAVPIQWKPGPSRLEIRIEEHRLRVWQDGQLLATSTWDSQHQAKINNLTLKSGDGVYGPFRGTSVDNRTLDGDKIDGDKIDGDKSDGDKGRQ